MSDAEIIAELRIRTIRLVALHGEETMPNGPWGDKVKVASLKIPAGEIMGGRILRFEVVNGRAIRVGISHEDWGQISEPIYDTDKTRRVVDMNLINGMLLPLMRREMLLDDLASV